MRAAGNLVVHFTEFTLPLFAVFWLLATLPTLAERNQENGGTNQTRNDITDTLIVTT
jgi:hypothetical protein